ncbi:hypothetical protein OK016_29070 [Vibrio chagasii]|nr:hypothetical protein [Vibrio chagasii]
MIPILCSIAQVVKKAMTGKKGAALSSSYVLGMATSYAMTGILVTTLAKASIYESSYATALVAQHFCRRVRALALACFGFYEQLPATFATKLNSGSDKSWAAVKLLAYSRWARYHLALINHLVLVHHWLVHCFMYPPPRLDVWWCYPVVMALGMGVPLIAVIGASGGRLLLEVALGWYRLSKYLAYCYSRWLSSY